MDVYPERRNERPRDDGGEPRRVLVALLFVDIVGSTRWVVELGDRAWREQLDRFLAAARAELDRSEGREVDAVGDGLLAAFDGATRAVRCAGGIVRGARALGLEVRAGVHVGECEVDGGRLRGVSLHLGARLAALAEPGEVLVSGTVRDVVAGSGLRFRDRGVHELRGLPGRHRVYSARGEANVSAGPAAAGSPPPRRPTAAWVGRTTPGAIPPP
ncbi:MAG TPA: adenylate/guanylate cyclase domain-containing protein [Actinomycetota bacterium]|nr:adenylate/guanylate cyclase domain-containing protein [Actinomycetota bacterium]